MNVFLGIDQSYSGMAVSAYYPTVNENQEFLSSYPASRFGSGISRIMRIKEDLEGVLHAVNAGDWTIAHVCMEGYASERKFGRELSGELGAAVKMALVDALPSPVCYPTIVPPTSLKKFVTGAGNAAKDNMLLGVYKKWGKEFKDNNLADAYGLARLAEAVHTRATAFKYEDESIAKLTPHTELFPNAA